MDEPTAIGALAALAHAHRLRLFRILVRAGADGLPAGDLAERLGIAPSTLSFHLSRLESARLVASRRAHRHVFYSIDVVAVRELLAFLTEDCCERRPELCGLAVDVDRRSA